MRKGDFIWGAIMLIIAAIFVLPSSREAFISFTTTHPLVGGFIKFGILASMGELLAVRVGTGKWKFAKFFFARAIIWGLFGILITMIFTIYATGITALLSKGMLPGGTSKLAFAFFTSFLMNATFAPTFMYVHRISDQYLDLKAEGEKDLSLSNVVKHIDTVGFWSFVVLKTVPFFWIPAHTLTFLLPNEYRILAAALLSMALGLILTITKKSKLETVED
ncbi:hypothetical protein [Fusibacter ferrireducens]|uniref:Mpv17 / PMP22 family protein n=1 Tax=Fusibacter ferrireducens TaxID=2785058 RepID=A0ABR9ZW33_9FIRM|nr:hypothetical protein [Fusibacter ferrireducens]MBF4694678.1 hypothetical protein [Fusibacter ferrireducens]